MLVNGLLLASAVTFTASMTYLVTRMYNKYCKAPIAQPETSDTNISDPNLMEINSKKVKIYHSDSSEDGKDYAIVDISSKKAKYTKATHDSSHPSTSDSHIYETIDTITDQGYATDSAAYDNVNLKKHSCVTLNQEKNPYIRIQFNSQPDVKIDIDNKGSEIPIYDDCGPYHDYHHTRPVTVIENPNFHAPVEQYHDDSNLLGLSESTC
ncbi:MAG TPA: hypothetical protein LFV92_07825 [Rickettsia endosymbiont of Ceroptres masudai]|nr:hypothetical protein [Rickettsia endosymbiont of Ceroptres masudai]